MRTCSCSDGTGRMRRSFTDVVVGLSAVVAGWPAAAGAQAAPAQPSVFYVETFQVANVDFMDSRWADVGRWAAEAAAAEVKAVDARWMAYTRDSSDAFLRDQRAREGLGCPEGQDALRCFIHNRGVSDLLFGRVERVGADEFRVLVVRQDHVGKDLGRELGAYRGSQEDVLRGVRALVRRLLGGGAAASAFEGFLELRVEPEGATLLIDDGRWTEKLAGGVQRVKLPVGQHAVELRLPDHLPDARVVRIEAGETTQVEARLRLRPRLVVQCLPGGRVSVDGEPRGESPAIVRGLQEGSYVVRCAGPAGYLQASQTVEVAAGEVRELRMELMRTPRLTVDCGRPDATAQVTDPELSGPSGHTFQLPRAGEFEVRCEGGGLASGSEEVELEAGEIRTLTLEMRPKRREPSRVYGSLVHLRFGYAYHLLPMGSLEVEPDRTDIPLRVAGEDPDEVDLGLRDAEAPVNPSGVVAEVYVGRGQIGFAGTFSVLFSGSVSVPAYVYADEPNIYLWSSDADRGARDRKQAALEEQLRVGVEGRVTDVVAIHNTYELLLRHKVGRLHPYARVGMGWSARGYDVEFTFDGIPQSATFWEAGFLLPVRAGADLFLTDTLHLHADYALYLVPDMGRGLQLGLGFAL